MKITSIDDNTGFWVSLRLKLKRSWELRLALAIPATLGLLQPWLPRDLIWFAKVPVALLMKWNILMANLGGLIGKLPFIQPQTALSINAITVYLLSISALYVTHYPNEKPSKLHFVVRLILMLFTIIMVFSLLVGAVSDTYTMRHPEIMIQTAAFFFLLIFIESKLVRKALGATVFVFVVLQCLYWINILPWADAVDKILSNG